MGKETVWDNLRIFIGDIAWRVFIWSTLMTEQQYFDMIYENEKDYREFLSTPEAEL